MTKCFEFEVALLGIQPRIWRRFLIAADANFLHLHEAIQAAGPWDNYHLFTFQTRKGHPIAGLPDRGSGDPDARTVALTEHFNRPGKDICLYVYDFGDEWVHEVVFRGVVETPQARFRSLVDGARAFPPEDSGGPLGYEEWVQVAKGRRKDPERKEWLGDWNPEDFDLAEARRSFDLKTRPKRYSGHYQS